MPLKAFNAEDEPTINLTPMIDCVFLLLIFFMVGTTFAERERQVDVKLPTVSDALPLTNLPDEMVINVVGEGTIVIRDERLTLEQLEDKLKAAKRNYADQAVVIRGSGPDPYQHVMDVLAICHRAEINHISLANRLQEQP